MKKENHNITLNKTNSLNSSLNSTSKYKNTSGFADKLERFVEYPDVRHRKLLREEARNDHLGPGSYDIESLSKSSLNKIKTPNFSKQHDSRYYDKTFLSDAPPVGTYNIPRILSPIKSPSKRCATSSFKNSGREKALLTNGKYYETLNEDKTLSNIGPGMYDISPYPSYRGQQLINPSFTDYRYRNHRQHDDYNDSRRMSENYHTKRPSMSEILGKTNLQRPHTSTATLSSSTSTSINNASTTSLNNNQTNSISPSERLHDIEIVKNLPDYPQRYR